MTLETFLKIFTIPNIIHWSYESPSFIIKPSTYFNIYINKGKEEKTLQALYYVTVSYLLLFLFSSEITNTSFLRYVVIDLLFIIMPFITLYISTKLIGKFSKKNITVKQIFAFIFIYKSFLTIACTILFFLFVKLERYEFYFLVNMVFSAYLVFIYFFSLIVFHNRIRYFFIGVLLNYLIINTQTYIIAKFMQFDDFSSNIPELLPSDPIYKEFINTYHNISSNFFIKPKGRLNLTLAKNKPMNFYILLDSHLKTKSIDSIADYGLIYYNSLIKTKLHLDSAIGTLRFNRNKQIFASFKKYCDNLIEYHKTSENDTSTIQMYRSIYISTYENPKQKIGQASFYNLPNGLSNSLDSTIIISQNLVDKSNSSETIMDYTFTFLFYPLYYIIED